LFYGAAEMGRSAARFHTKICSTFAQNGCGGGVQVAQRDATEPEFGHRKLRHDFKFSELGYV
jgi:hypothetical protein